MKEEQYECTRVDESVEQNGWFPKYEACSKELGDYEGISRESSGAIRVTRYLGCVTMGKMLINKIRIPEGFIEAEHIDSKLRLNTCKVCGDTIFLTGCLTETINYVTSMPPMPPTPTPQPTPKSTSPMPIISSVLDTDDDNGVEGQGQFHSTIKCIGHPKVRKVKNKTILVDIPISMSMRVDFLERVRLRRSRNERVFYNQNTLQPCGRGFVGICPCESFSEDFVVLNKGFKCDVEGYKVSQVDINKIFDFPPCGICGGAVGTDGEAAVVGTGFCNKYFVIEEKMLLQVLVSVYMDDLEFGNGDDPNQEDECLFQENNQTLRGGDPANNGGLFNVGNQLADEDILWNPRLDEDQFMTKSGFIK